MASQAFTITNSPLYCHLTLQPITHCLRQGLVPAPDTLAAHIMMIPKSALDALDPQAYRPISLLNEDMKIPGRILGSRFNRYLHSLIHRDQVDFVPGLQAGDKVRKVVHLIHLLQCRKIPGFLLSIDIYKAFDSLSWDYLRYVLKRWGFGHAILHWIAALYSSPSATVRYAGHFSTSFPISHGTRRGCPLSDPIYTSVGTLSDSP